MPRRERDRELARRRKRKKERRKLRAKGLLPPTMPQEKVKEGAQKPEKAAVAKEPPKAPEESPAGTS